MTIVIPMQPGRVKANGRLVPQRVRGVFTGRLVLSSVYREGLEEMALRVRQACVLHRWRKTIRPVRVVVTTWWPRNRGDLDATCKAACDSLTNGGAIFDDDQIVAIELARGVDKVRPRIEIEITEVRE